MKDIIIIGAGTAGLTAAIYALRAGKSVVVFESKYYGGQIVTTPEIENYPGVANQSGYEFAQKLYEQAIHFGAEFEYEEVISIQNVTNVKVARTPNDAYEASAVIIASGAKKRPLGLEREKELVGKGISYCGTCDGRFYTDKEVLVYGGGNTAIEEAALLAGYCKKVTLISRSGDFSGDMTALAKLKKKGNVAFLTNTKVTGLYGEDKLTSVEVFDESMRQRTQIATAGLFVAIGQIPDNGAFRDIVALDGHGYIVAGENCKTSCDGIFAAGDCRTKQIRQLTTAAGDGTVAALEACAYIDRITQA